MAYDLNSAEEQRDYGQLIPDGTFARLKGILKDGAATLPGSDPRDLNLFKEAKSGSLMLDFEFIVQAGPHAKQKLWQQVVIMAGPEAKRDEKGVATAENISRSFCRALMESGQGIAPNDKSPEAMAKRVLPYFRFLHGIEFAARIGVQAGGDKEGGGTYNDKNVIAIVVVPGMPEYLPTMQGQPVEPKPSGRASGGGGAKPAAAQPQLAMWGQPGGATAAAPAAAPAAGPAPAWAQPDAAAAPAAAAPIPAQPSPAPAAAPLVSPWGGGAPALSAAPAEGAPTMVAQPASGGVAGPAWLAE